jgi:hypothetical protein
MAERGPGCPYVYVGEMLLGAGSFAFDPWWLYAQEPKVITSPNVMLFGAVGAGKSALTKTYLLRQMTHGRRGWVLDPKGEYAPLVDAVRDAGWEAAHIILRPDSGIRLNPMDQAVPRRARVNLLRAIAVAAVDRPLQPREVAVVRAAHDEAVRVAAAEGREPLLGDVASAMLHPTEAMAADLVTDPTSAHAEGRDVALAFRTLVEDDLAGMFDGPTTAGIDFTRQLVVIDVSWLATDPQAEGALAAAMACTTTFLQGELERQAVDGNLLVVLDEAWLFMRMPAMARWLSGAFKFTRKYGCSIFVVFHRLTDLNVAGDDGELVKGLLEDVQVQVVYQQAAASVKEASVLLGLTSVERDELPGLASGEALWRIAGRSTLVKHRVDAEWEWPIVDTDQAMVRT